LNQSDVIEFPSLEHHLEIWEKKKSHSAKSGGEGQCEWE